jgi:hypothetical protein
MKTRTLELADDWGLDIVEITRGRNGYPEGLYKAVARFDYFENAEDFADKVNGEVVLLSRRDGHQLWTNNGRAYEGIERAKFIDEDRYEVFEDELEFEEWCVGEIDHRMDMGFNLFEFRDKIDQMCDTYEEIRTAHRSEITIVDTRNYTYETTDKYVTEIHDEDVTTYMIAVVDYETDEDETNEEEED